MLNDDCDQFSFEAPFNATVILSEALSGEGCHLKEIILKKFIPFGFCHYTLSASSYFKH